MAIIVIIFYEFLISIFDNKCARPFGGWALCSSFLIRHRDKISQLRAKASRLLSNWMRLSMTVTCDTRSCRNDDNTDSIAAVYCSAATRLKCAVATLIGTTWFVSHQPSSMPFWRQVFDEALSAVGPPRLKRASSAQGSRTLAPVADDDVLV